MLRFPTLPHLPRAAWPALALALCLSACGGGGGKEEPIAVTPPVIITPPAPVVEVTGQGELKQATRLKSVSVAELAAAVRDPATKAPTVVPRYAVDNWRIDYLTLDEAGKLVTASGLVSVPVKPAGTRSPLISYQHGTTFKNAEVPSNKVEAAEPSLLLASMGAIVVAADYVGYGSSKGIPHPYLLSAPTAAAVIDLLTAARTWRQRNALADNGQLFLVGYSEGGYATMAAHRALQAGVSVHKAQLVGTVPGAGPYDVGVTLDALLDRVRQENRVLGALINPGFLRYLGSTVRDEVRRNLIKAALPDDADVQFQATFIDNYLADDTEAVERDSNVHDWRPDQPVRMYHGQQDQTVPYASSTATLRAMRARAAPDVSLTDCTAQPAGHLECVQPYFAWMLQQLAPVIRDL